MNGAIGMDYVDMPLDGAIDMHHNRPYSEFHLKSDLVFDEFPFVDLDSFQETCLKQKLRIFNGTYTFLSILRGNKEWLSN